VKLLARHDRDLWRYILSLVPDPSSADDILQETATALWRKFPEYEPTESFLHWAFGFARLEVLKHRQQAGRKPLLFDDSLLALLADERSQEQSAIEARRGALSFCLESLSPEDRQLLDARYQRGVTVAALAALTGQPAKRMYNSLDRVRRRLLDCMTRRLEAEGST
jgi:RNA polymerase sigma-70 factor (ECF subfamily)